MEKLRTSGLDEGTLYQTEYQLSELNEKSDLFNPEEIKKYIAGRKNKDGKPSANSYKNNLLKGYAYFASMNGIQWTRPYFHYERKVPRIPTTEAINKIIAASSRKYATIFTVLTETGFEGKELERVSRDDIEATQGVINAQGCKSHLSRPIKLTEKTADMLRWYLIKYTDKFPFPRSDNYSRIWERTRNQLAETLEDPELKKVQLRHLRHYQATMFYDKTKDIIATKNRLGHKKIETTMLYTQLIAYNENEEYTAIAVEKMDVKKVLDLVTHGFKQESDLGTLLIFKKRK